jgi:hypothetical protein
MLVIVASRFDADAHALAAGWPGPALVLTPADLSMKGWRHVTGADENTAVIGGRMVAASEIDGVLTRLPAVLESELGSIAADDRAYVAAEMTAWLAAWLWDLPCPVLNRPSPVHLIGPAWSREQWLLAARRLGIPSVTVSRSTRTVGGASGPGGGPAGTGRVVVTVAGGRPIGAGGDTLTEAAAALAEAAGVELLRAWFTSDDEEALFVGADYSVDLEHPEVRAAILARLAEVARP